MRPFRIASRARRAAAVAAAGATLLLLGGCAVPLAPGYAVEKESLAVRYVPGPAPRLAVAADYRLRNVGTTELSFLDVALPGESVYGREGLRVTWDGREVALEAAPAAPGLLRLPLSPAWPRRRQGTLHFEYTLAGSAEAGQRIRVGGRAVLLEDFGWFPVLQTPKHLFAHDVGRPDRTPVSFTLPAVFRVLSSGAAVASRRSPSEIERRFRLRTGDTDPYLVAGQYQEFERRNKGVALTFWTFSPLAPADADGAAARLIATLHTFIAAFGPLAKGRESFWIVETSAPFPGGEASPGPSGRAFPSGALLASGAFASGVRDEAFLSLAEDALARVWFTRRATPVPEQRLALANGLARYATIVAAEARDGPDARKTLAAAVLADYDRARDVALERPIADIAAGTPVAQKRMAIAKTALFFLALEDRCGPPAVRHALARVIAARAGDNYAFRDIRAALEAESHEDLGEMFRIWLSGAGIPDEFRARFRSP